jgi:hypothetical protein
VIDITNWKLTEAEREGYYGGEGYYDTEGLAQAQLAKALGSLIAQMVADAEAYENEDSSDGYYALLTYAVMLTGACQEAGILAPGWEPWNGNGVSRRKGESS